MSDSQILDYVAQYDSSTCQSACIAKMLGTYEVPRIRAELLLSGAAGSPYNMGDYLRPRVKSYEFLENGSLSDAVGFLQDGFQLITHGWFTGSGHVISIVDYSSELKKFLVDDPWFEFDFSTWSYDYRYSGNNVYYSALGIFAACVISTSPPVAERLYKQGVADWDAKGMWIHAIKN